jgi:1-acyl-sn-glycerol-3-phosphate acyltransferase
MMRTVFSFIAMVVSMLFVTPFGMIGLILWLIGFRKSMSVAMYLIAHGWARFLLAVVGCTVTVSGRENIPRTGGVCFVSNHCGISDILLVLGYIGRPFGFIAKKELLLIPVLNMWIAILGGLFIDRKNFRKALKTINTGVGRIKSGGAMIVFPEGHRSRGKGLLPFHPGSLKLATQSAAAIVPVAITGTYELFEKNNRVTACPLSITFCSPIDTAAIPLTDRKTILSDQIYAVIKKELGV